MKKYRRSAFIFRRDLRLFDNRSLLECIENSKSVLPLFIFNEHQINPKKNEYFSPRSFNFMLESLHDLQSELQQDKGELYVYKEKLSDVVETLVRDLKVEALYVTNDYTPFSLKRDEHLQDLCNQHEIDFVGIDDLLLCNPHTALTGTGDHYKVFTPFWKNAREQRVAECIAVSGKGVWMQDRSLETDIDALAEKHEIEAPDFTGGRAAALSQMKHIDTLATYKEIRDFPATLGTTKLSPHLKFGTVSAREVYHKTGKLFGYQHHLITELYWRDFYAYLSLHFPHVFTGNFNQSFDSVKWDKDKKKFKAWCEGKTGFPIVDAGMRELNQTGWMHNRVRMIVASFLTKDLHIHWQWGEKYFAQQLVDYDPATNNGSWQWAASTGADAQPYFRIFNPWLQQKRFDPEAEYIKKWVPELEHLDARNIHTLDQQPLYIPPDYYKPIVEHKRESQEAKDRFKAA